MPRHVPFSLHNAKEIYFLITYGFFSGLTDNLITSKFVLRCVAFQIQWNLSLADMLYSGHPSITDIFSRKQFSPAMVKPLYFESLYSGQLFIADTFSENQWCPLLRVFTVTQ